MPHAWSSLGRHRDLLAMLVARNLKVRYKNSALGFFWTLLGPLFLILVYAAFLGIMRFEIDLRVLVSGILVWQFLAMCAGDALQAISGNANLVKKAAFPRGILVLSMALANLLNFLLSLLVLAVYLAIAGTTLGAFGWLPLAIVSQFALCLGLGLALAAANVYFRDTEHIMGTVLMAWFFLTPIIYAAALVTDRFAARPWIGRLYFLNPMAGLVSAYRRFFLGATDVEPVAILLSCAGAWLVLAAGAAIFHRAEPRFAEVL